MTIETWLIVTIVLCVIEAITVGLTTIWFAFGALVAALVCWLGGGLWLQLFAFLLVSIVLLILTRPLVVKYLNRKTVKTNADRLIGQQCLVVEEIHNLKETGQIKINGLTWTARSVHPEQVISKGETVVIEAIEGVKAMVRLP
jgi:membrane protein implicated in regulation of membrane protease activity